MTRLLVDPREPAAASIARAAAVIRAGGVVAYPTDTLYGLAVDPRDPRAVAGLFRVKGRPDDRAIPLVAADHATATQAGRFTPLTRAPLARTASCTRRPYIPRPPKAGSRAGCTLTIRPCHAVVTASGTSRR